MTKSKSRNMSHLDIEKMKVLRPHGSCKEQRSWAVPGFHILHTNSSGTTKYGVKKPKYTNVPYVQMKVYIIIIAYTSCSS